jgi:hypothetical protein
MFTIDDGVRDPLGGICFDTREKALRLVRPDMSSLALASCCVSREFSAVWIVCSFVSGGSMSF